MAPQIYQADPRLLAEIDGEISVLVCRIADLRARRNALMPISLLPNELLSRVFAELLFEADSEAVLPPSHVCRFWRAVALEARGLWVQPKLDRVELGRMMLERAGSLPLVLTIHDDIFAEDTSTLVSVFVAEAVARVRELRVELKNGLRNNAARETLRTWLATAASNLVYLDSLGCWIRSVEALPIFPGVDVLPALKVLRAPSWAIGDCRVHRLPNLTTLELDGDDSNLYCPVSHICAMLQNLKALQVLVLRNVMDTADFWAGSIMLPHLRHFNLEDSVTLCLQLVKVLHYPANTRVWVYCSPGNDDLELETLILYPELVALLRGNWLASGRTAFHEMCIGEDVLLLRLYNMNMLSPPNYDEHLSALRIELAFYRLSLENVLPPAAQVLPSLNSQVNKLVLHADHNVDLYSCPTFDDASRQQLSAVLLGNSGRGDILVVYGCRLRLLCSVFSTHRSSRRDTEGPAHIQLVNPQTIDDDDMQCLHEWLEYRVARNGRPLETLDIQLSNSTLLHKPSMLGTYWDGLVENVTIGCKEIPGWNRTCGGPLPYNRDERSVY